MLVSVATDLLIFSFVCLILSLFNALTFFFACLFLREFNRKKTFLKLFLPGWVKCRGTRVVRTPSILIFYGGMIFLFFIL